MSSDLVQMRLMQSDRWRELSRWDAEVDVRDGEQMRDALVGAVKGHVGEDDWRRALPLHVLQWRWGSSTGWRTFRAAK